jgi:cation:H+ antiporter
MSTALAGPIFVLGALVSLGTSWVLVSRLERLGERLGLSEGLLGMVAALAADAPEVTSAVTALSHHERTLGAGVVIGSNVFNLAGLLGLGALVAGRIALHRKVVLLGGSVAVWIAALCLTIALGWIPALPAVILALAAVGLYVIVLSGGAGRLAYLRVPSRCAAWLASAVSQEEQELQTAIRPTPATPIDVIVAAVSLVVVVAASVAMERAASTLGTDYGIAEIVIGGLVLAAVTSLPNVVAAVYLAARGRGAATFSIALNSNTLNVVVGLFIPALIVGLGNPSAQTTLIAAWYLGLTMVVLGCAYVARGITRAVGILIILAYMAFVGSVALSARSVDLRIVIVPPVVVAVAFGLRLTRRRGSHSLSTNLPLAASSDLDDD